MRACWGGGKSPEVPGYAQTRGRFSVPGHSDLTVTRLGERREVKAEQGKTKSINKENLSLVSSCDP